MCKFIHVEKSNEQISCKLSISEILRLYSIIHVAMETTKMSNFICQSKSFISLFFTCQVSACELQPFSYHDLANDMHSVFSHLNGLSSVESPIAQCGRAAGLVTIRSKVLLLLGLIAFFLLSH